MNIRDYKPSDIGTAKKIFDTYYSKDKYGELAFNDMLRDYLCAFVVEDDNKVITVGGVRPIAEVTLLTDKSQSVRDRVEALKLILPATGFIAREFKFDWLHAVTDDPVWANQMKQHGLIPRGEHLEIHVGDIK